MWAELILIIRFQDKLFHQLSLSSFHIDRQKPKRQGDYWILHSPFLQCD